ncbi:Formate/nitrite transporter [Kitasatospora sp. MMS16-BH015]|uniref:formate/nitrite transporter family protein n=1 Tax=Kitasatospora sp. MMS16-BH015 TaxID=2018025 RepID=UPI000CA305ED|nr:formate/nitrite transporter family protein [Kitasatospora sp. MMS16-BH015]AUG78048.1 Formate/nitrite transporter [Kitasatospora sp. MMS16-BH015]
MIGVAESLDATAETAVRKAAELRSPGRMLVSSMLAGAFIGVGEVLLLAAVSPLVAGHSPWVKLVEGAVFPIALTMVMFAGAQLFTSNVLVMTVGALAGRTGRRDLAGSWGFSLLGNLAGAFGFAALVHASGVLAAPAAQRMLAELVHGKEALGGGELFWRGVLCNFLVCLAVWMFGRVEGDGAKALVLWLPVLVFVAVGFEHCVADMALYALGVLDGSASVGGLLRTLLYVVPGNAVGGAVLVGLAYWVAGRPARPA